MGLEEFDGVAALLTRLMMDRARDASVVDTLEVHLDDLSLVDEREFIQSQRSRRNAD